MLNRFKQQRVFITGGASGLGKALVEAFAKMGWSIWIADINSQMASDFKQQLEASNPSLDIRVSQCDITSEEDLLSLSQSIAEQWGSLDIIINNAGIASSGLLEDTNLAQWNRTIDTNLTGVFQGCYRLASLLPDTTPGQIVNIASFAGIAQAPGMVAYNVSKAGVIALSESLRIELGHRNIGVTVACPAFFQTNLVDSMHGSSDAVKQQVQKWMATSKIDAHDVALDILKGIERNKFMVISHDYARKIYWLKRFFPAYYMRKAMAMVPKLKQRLSTK